LRQRKVGSVSAGQTTPPSAPGTDLAQVLM
jgi:hypothetical protein